MAKTKQNPLCNCGCGQETNIAPRNHEYHGWIKGEHMQYVKGHQARGSNNGRWKGGRRIIEQGYVMVKQPDHHRANSNGYVLEHLVIAENVLGEPLPKGAVVHHINGNKADNRKHNLVICQDENYHKLLHKRLRALKD